MTAYRGDKAWAPCFHDQTTYDADVDRYVREVLSKGQPAQYADGIPGRAGIEDMLWALGLAWYYGETQASLTWGFYADQWVGVSLEIARPDAETVYLWTEADTFTLAIAKSIERLKDAGYWPAIVTDEDAAE